MRSSSSRIVFQPFAQDCQHLLRTFSRRANDEDETKLFFVLAVQLRQRVRLSAAPNCEFRIVRPRTTAELRRRSLPRLSSRRFSDDCEMLPTNRSARATTKCDRLSRSSSSNVREGTFARSIRCAHSFEPQHFSNSASASRPASNRIQRTKFVRRCTQLRNSSINSQPAHAAIGKNIEPQMRNDAGIQNLSSKKCLRVGLQLRARQQRLSSRRDKSVNSLRPLSRASLPANNSRENFL